ncbi:hypothetical protein, partial [uncultured Campylobacter sp.]|uniref:hypothetical protein n=1 Tax=uncultured Campylobacter sp. TaxID=218934 RepID=UPI002637BC83
ATEHEKINFYIKDFLQKIHYLDNYPAKDIKKMKNIHRDINDFAETRFYLCNGDKYPDDKCEFFKLDKRLNLEYLLNLGSKICNADTPMQNAQEIIDNDEILKIEPFYPFNEKYIIDENGKFLENFVYIGENKHILFSDFVFINKKVLKYHDTKNDIVIVSNIMFSWLLANAIVNKEISEFCVTHNLLITNKKRFFEKTYGREYYFKYIPTNRPTLQNIVFNDFAYNGDYYYNTILEQYQTLKNNNFNKNLNLQGGGNAKN